MPVNQPIQSYHSIRNFTEKFSWIDIHGLRVTGYNPPKDAKMVDRVPFHIKGVLFARNKDGYTGYFEGNAICIKVDRRNERREIKMTQSGEIRWIYDKFIIEIDGTRFVS